MSSFLSDYGVEHILFDRKAEASALPKAHYLNQSIVIHPKNRFEGYFAESSASIGFEPSEFSTSSTPSDITGHTLGGQQLKVTSSSDLPMFSFECPINDLVVQSLLRFPGVHISFMDK